MNTMDANFQIKDHEAKPTVRAADEGAIVLEVHGEHDGTPYHAGWMLDREGALRLLADIATALADASA